MVPANDNRDTIADWIMSDLYEDETDERAQMRRVLTEAASRLPALQENAFFALFLKVIDGKASISVHAAREGVCI